MMRLRLLPLVSSLAVFVMIAFGEQGVLGQATGAGEGAASATPAAPVVLKGKLERVKVKGRSLEGNLMKESDSPEVSIYLPPGYVTDRTRRFPVVYLLHGYTGT